MLTLTALVWGLAGLSGSGPASAGEGAAIQSAVSQAARPRVDAPTLYVVRYLPGPAYRHDRPLLQQDLAAHARYMAQESEAGTIIAAGPTFEQTGGLVLIRSANRDAALAFVRSDPAVSAGLFVGEVTDWKPVFDPGSRFGESGRPVD